MRTTQTLLTLIALTAMNSTAQATQPASKRTETAGESTAAASRPASRPTPQRQEPRSQKIRWPEDRDRVICSVLGRDYTAGAMIDYIEKNHRPGLNAFLEMDAGKLYFQNPIIARWVRQFADIVALRIEAERRGIDLEAANERLGEALKLGFERWLGEYVAKRREGGIEAPLTDTARDIQLGRFQAQFGLETELGGWLSILVPATPVEEGGKLRDYYAENARTFGGLITAAQILVRHRDPHTGELLIGKDRRRVLRKLRDVQARLAADGSNFEDIARLLSDDQVTAAKGGILRNIKRFDPLLPAALCRAVWTVPEGKVLGPVESPYGYHFVKRLSFSQPKFVIYNDRVAPEIAGTKRTHEQEQLIFSLREAMGVKLQY